MAIRISVLCRSNEPVSYGELENVMGHFGWLDNPAVFTPTPDETTKARTDWGMFSVRYSSTKRPIVVHQFVTTDDMAPTIEDLNELLEDADDSETKADVKTRLLDVKRMFEFEIPSEPPDDVWDMLDAAETHLARERDGIIFAEEGVFDGNMKQLLVFQRD